MFDNTMKFSIGNDKEVEMKQILTTVYDALKEKGYEPYEQLYGYIKNNEPSYITRHNGARDLIITFNKKQIQQYIEEMNKNS